MSEQTIDIGGIMKKKLSVWCVILLIIIGILLALFYMKEDNQTTLSDLLIEIFSSFLGFGLALVANDISDVIKTNNECLLLITNLHTELLNVKTALEDIDENLCWINPIKIPYLKSSIQTQKIALLSNKPYDTIHTRLIELEDTIDDYNAWHKLITESVAYSNGNKNRDISGKIHEIKESITSKIDSLIIEITKYL